MGSCSVAFSAEMAAAILWTFGEDALVDRALRFTADERHRIGDISGALMIGTRKLPLTTNVTIDKVVALACIEFLEGRIRPLAQERRRPKTKMPTQLRNAGPPR